MTELLGRRTVRFDDDSSNSWNERTYKKIKKSKKNKSKKISAAELREIRREKNETKNIIKNFGKEIILFVSTGDELIKKILT